MNTQPKTIKTTTIILSEGHEVKYSVIFQDGKHHIEVSEIIFECVYTDISQIQPTEKDNKAGAINKMQEMLEENVKQLIKNHAFSGVKIV